MTILIVGNVIKDVYLNLDNRTESFETDKHDTKWLNLSFNNSEHRFFNRSSNLGGASISLEVLTKLSLTATINNSDLKFTPEGPVTNQSVETHRYIILADDKPTYFVPTSYRITPFTPPTEPCDFLFIDRSAELNQSSANKIHAYLDISTNTKLILYVRTLNNPNLNSLIPRASLIFFEGDNPAEAFQEALPQHKYNPSITICITENSLSCQSITESISIDRINMFTHLSAYSIAAATVLGSFILGKTIEESLRLARTNVENSKLNSTLTLDELNTNSTQSSQNDLELIAKNLVLFPKGILAADESGGSIHKKFAQLQIPDTYENRRDYRNLFFTTDHLADYVNGVILFDETARQTADNGQSFTDFLIAKRIIPGIKVDEGLIPLKPNSLETITQGLDGLSTRLAEYYQMGLRFAKWRAAFEIRLNTNNKVLTPTADAIKANCDILANYASECQKAGLVPIVEPEVVYDGYYDIDKSSEVTATILDQLFESLKNTGINLRACILKVNMVLAGKQYEVQSAPTEIGQATSEVLKNHVPSELAGVVFLSGGQTPEQATDNLSEIIKHGPYPWPVTFSFARALQDPALFAWQGDNNNAETAKSAFLERLKANSKALKSA